MRGSRPGTIRYRVGRNTVGFWYQGFSRASAPASRSIDVMQLPPIELRARNFPGVADSAVSLVLGGEIT